MKFRNNGEPLSRSVMGTPTIFENWKTIVEARQMNKDGKLGYLHSLKHKANQRLKKPSLPVDPLKPCFANLSKINTRRSRMFTSLKHHTRNESI